MESRKQAILTALDAFVNQRSGMDFRNYGDVKSYRAEQRGITRDLHDYRELRAAVVWREGITAEMLLYASRSAFSGRLTLDTRSDDGAWRVDYCTGQYFPTEYRKAACAVLASALWAYTREHSMAAPLQHRVLNYGADESPSAWGGIHTACEERERRGGEKVCYIEDRYSLLGRSSKRMGSAGDWLRAYFRREFGRGIAARWFH